MNHKQWWLVQKYKKIDPIFPFTLDGKTFNNLEEVIKEMKAEGITFPCECGNNGHGAGNAHDKLGRPYCRDCGRYYFE